jgi:clan AA aspartic protease (TIGR02281 family)
MKTASLFVLVAMTIFAAPETELQVGRIADLFILNKVYLNGQGPFRMMIDTGNSSSAVGQDAANRLGLRPVYAVQAETAAGAKTVAAAILDEVRIGPLRDNGVEVMIMDLTVPGVDGVLGQSWLIRHDYALDYQRCRFVVDIVAPPAGVRVPLRSSDGRPQVSAEVNSRRQDLVVDSGTSVLVLFVQIPSTTTQRLVTNVGSVKAGARRARVVIGGSYSRQLTAVEVNASSQPGLLPAAAFKSVYISNRDGVVVLVP